MRAMLLPGLAILLLAPLPAMPLSGGERGRSEGGVEDARAVVEKAIEAHGGEAKLAKLKMVSTKAKGVINLGAALMPFALETVWQWPDRLKNVLKLDADATATLVETVAGGDSWSSRDGKPVFFDRVKRDELRTQAHVHRLLLLTPLLRDNTYELSALEEIRIHDRPARRRRQVCGRARR